MQKDQRLTEVFKRFPFIAILRGIRPEESLDMAEALVESGFGILEIPLNSPQPLESIRRLSAYYRDSVIIGAGTVTTSDQVKAVHQAGGRIVLSPHCNPQVIEQTRACGMIAMPGIATPTEAFSALAAGADALKLFPAELITPAVMQAMAAILPPGCPLVPVGGIDEHNWQQYFRKGASGFGLGSSLYRRGASAEETRLRARVFQASWMAEQEFAG